MPKTEASTKTVYLLGDSITQGLGSKKVNFDNELLSLLGEGYNLVNLAFTGTTVDYGLNLVAEGNVARDSICVILYGNVDAQIRPSRTGRVFPRIPKRYQGGGMLMPRPFYSRSLRKRVGQKVDNFARAVFSGLIKAIDGTEQWMPLPEFSICYGKLLDELENLHVETITCSCVCIDEKLFPGCQAEYDRYNKVICSLASNRGLDICSELLQDVESHGWDHSFNKDHFHPNGVGYRLLAELIASEIQRI